MRGVMNTEASILPPSALIARCRTLPPGIASDPVVAKVPGLIRSTRLSADSAT